MMRFKINLDLNQRPLRHGPKQLYQKKSEFAFKFFERGKEVLLQILDVYDVQNLRKSSNRLKAILD